MLVAQPRGAGARFLTKATTTLLVILGSAYLGIALHLYRIPLLADPFHNQHHVYADVDCPIDPICPSTTFINANEKVPLSIWAWEPWRRVRDKGLYVDSRDRSVFEVLMLASS